VIVAGPGVVEWVAKRTNEYGNFGAAVGIGIERNGELAGGVALNEYNGVNINMHVAAAHPRWLTREFLFVIFDYCFRQAGVRRITGLVGEGNTRARRFDEKVGFKLETRLKDADPSGDLLVYVMRKEGCRWLKWRKENHAA
jgi:RimJ/RimL family protein N-acetyltransferase